MIIKVFSIPLVLGIERITFSGLDVAISDCNLHNLTQLLQVIPRDTPMIERHIVMQPSTIHRFYLEGQPSGRSTMAFGRNIDRIYKQV